MLLNGSIKGLPSQKTGQSKKIIQTLHLLDLRENFLEDGSCRFFEVRIMLPFKNLETNRKVILTSESSNALSRNGSDRFTNRRQECLHQQQTQPVLFFAISQVCARSEFHEAYGFESLQFLLLSRGCPCSKFLLADTPTARYCLCSTDPLKRKNPYQNNSI